MVRFPSWPQVRWLMLCIGFLAGISAITAADNENSASKRPVPSAADQREAKHRIDAVYRHDVEDAKGAIQKLALAAQILSSAESSAGSADAEKFVLFVTARDLAERSGSAALALRAVSELADWCDVDALKMRAEVLASTSKVPDESGAGGASREEFEALIGDAIAADRYDVAKEAAASASILAARSRNQKLGLWAVTRAHEVDELAVAHRSAAEAEETLRKMPDDHAAALTAGRFLCLYKGNWDRGLPLLVASNDATLQPLARDDLAGASDGAADVLLGDRWLSLGKSQSDFARRSANRRAAKWYRAAIPLLNGLARTAVEKKLDALAEHEWTVLFRSSDPSIWNTNTDGGANRYAIDLSHCPDDVRYFKLSAGNLGSIMLPITKDQLPNLNTGAKFNWNGSAHKEWGAIHLGIVNDISMANKGVGFIVVTEGYKGWGFGHRIGDVNGKQCWSWAGEEIPSTVFEISVLAAPLKSEELKSLLR